ncbi:helix-turn-helix domain-containing protein [Bordetella bronchiseptica]|uniref:helix-turn-helix domain-containing protein n=1 Tax=Bordetella bronchiseptica TaxID=518 RepID=UPI0009B8EE07|nr:helix-turn-helix transcriptional regulator [Bordetella bronchiseptica]
MNAIQSIRKRLGVTQAHLAAGIGMTQGNVSNYECGRQSVPPDVAARLIDWAKSLGHEITFDQIYRPELEAGRKGPEHA